MIKTVPLKGLKSLTALNAFSALLLGLKMIPEYLSVNYEEFYASFKDMDEPQREKLLRQAVAFVRLEKDEVEALVCFAADKNGVPFGPTNIKNLGPDELHEIIVAVCMEIGRINVNLVTEDEKKKYLTSRSISAEPSLTDLNLH